MKSWTNKEKRKLKERGFNWINNGFAEKGGSGGFSLGEYNRITLMKDENHFTVLVNRKCAERETVIEQKMRDSFQDLDSALSSFDEYDA